MRKSVAVSTAARKELTMQDVTAVTRQDPAAGIVSAVSITKLSF